LFTSRATRYRCPRDCLQRCLHARGRDIRNKRRRRISRGPRATNSIWRRFCSADILRPPLSKLTTLPGMTVNDSAAVASPCGSISFLRSAVGVKERTSNTPIATTHAVLSNSCCGMPPEIIPRPCSPCVVAFAARVVVVAVRGRIYRSRSGARGPRSTYVSSNT
jgi:hypothetical protein